MALSGTLIAGQYTVTYNSVAVGYMEGDAGCPTIEHTMHAELVNNTDQYGKMLIDWIYQGVDETAQFTCMEYNPGSRLCFWPFIVTGGFATLGTIIVPTTGPIGRLGYDMSMALVLTAIAGTPAQLGAAPATLTASHAILAPNFPTRRIFGPTLRKLPIRMVLFPYTGGSGTVGHTET
jgi:hypothetical protein